MTIRAVFRVRCDGPCGGWLSQTGGVIHLNPPSRDVGLYPGERAARTAAQDNGWKVSPMRTGGPRVLCPTCKTNPLGIVLPVEQGRCSQCDHRHLGTRMCASGVGFICGCLKVKP